MKKVIFTLFALMISVSTFAQFERDTYYINTSFSKVGLSFSGQSKLSLAGTATAGQASAGVYCWGWPSLLHSAEWYLFGRKWKICTLKFQKH